MTTDPALHARSLSTTLAFALAFFACVAGLFMCFVKSPAAKSSLYMQTALMQESRAPLQARRAAIEAVRADPESPAAWRVLARVLQQGGEYETALRAGAIARNLQSGADLPPAPVIYATPAELRLSALGLSDSGRF